MTTKEFAEWEKRVEEEMKREADMVFETLVLNGYSDKDAQTVVDDYEYDIYPNCKTLGDIAKAIYYDEAQIVEDLEMASWVSVDWNGLAKHLNGNRDMFISDNGYGIVVE